MKKTIYIISLILGTLSSESCRKDYNISEAQQILFQMDYVNYAWGYQHYGFMIDNQGRVLTYDNPERWNFPDDNFILTERQVAENISLCRVSQERITAKELLKYSSYIDNIAASKVSSMRNVGADAGVMQYICYRFSEDSFIYKGFMLKTEGDFTAENLNFYSKRVVSWMKEIEESIPSE